MAEPNHVGSNLTPDFFQIYKYQEAIMNTMSYGLETIEEDSEYCIHLPEGETLKVTVNEDGDLEETMKKYGQFSEETVYPSGIESSLKSFIKARTGKKFETE
jgi:hypothetical protein